MEDRHGRSALNPIVGKISHAAVAYLDFLQRLGAPAPSTDRPWTPVEKQAAADRGPHPSTEAHRDFLWEEAVEMSASDGTPRSFPLPLSAARESGFWVRGNDGRAIPGT